MFPVSERISELAWLSYSFADEICQRDQVTRASLIKSCYEQLLLAVEKDSKNITA